MNEVYGKQSGTIVVADQRRGPQGDVTPEATAAKEIAVQSAKEAAVSAINAKNSELAAANSEANAKASELNAKTSELNAKKSEINSRESELSTIDFHKKTEDYYKEITLYQKIVESLLQKNIILITYNLINGGRFTERNHSRIIDAGRFTDKPDGLIDCGYFLTPFPTLKYDAFPPESDKFSIDCGKF